VRSIIESRDISKRYRIGASRQKYGSLRESLANWAASRFRGRGDSAAKHPSIWALKDVSFDIMPGEAVGVIGRNGAGKTTLLKILSRITEPTRGEARLYGRVGSLLEGGAGFHPELTGRENVYLSGAILGMRKAEIGRKFDEIVAFAELEQFIDTVVKHYSSGMYMRLAFSVAAHLDPEILLVDEVLAVGDIAFQRKCLGRMGTVASEGRTVVFVSHDFSAVQSLCGRVLLFEGGSLVADGPPRAVIARYVGSAGAQGSFQRAPSPGQKLAITRAELRRDNATQVAFLRGDTVQIYVEFQVLAPLRGAQLGFELSTEAGDCLFTSTDLDAIGSDPKRVLGSGLHARLVEVPLAQFRPGKYLIKLVSSIPGLAMLDAPADLLGFEVSDPESPVHRLGQGRRGVVLPILEWGEVRVEETGEQAAPGSSRAI
jgi:lipopolysaccharide transport system ATP-binding protein